MSASSSKGSKCDPEHEYLSHQMSEIRRQVDAYETLAKNNPNLSSSLLIQHLRRILDNDKPSQRPLFGSSLVGKEVNYETRWVQAVTEFEGMKLNPDLLRGLRAYGYDFPSATQQRVIVPCVSGWDVIAHIKLVPEAGRTAALVISVLQRIKRNDPHCPALILTKSDGDAEKIQAMILGLGVYMGITCRAFTSAPFVEMEVDDERGDDEINTLVNKHNYQIVVGTPAQILKMMNILDQPWVTSKNITMLLMDDADMLLGSDWQKQTFQVMKELGMGFQIVLMSKHEVPPENLEEIRKIMWNPVTITINDDDMVKKDMMFKSLKEFYLPVEMEDMKIPVLSELYEELTVCKSLVFCQSVEKVDKVVQTMRDKNQRVAAMHGDLEEDERERILEEFRTNLIPMLITTDLVHGSGIELYQQHFSLIINYDFPTNPETYIKRLSFGRRFGKGGTAISFLTEKDQTAFKKIQEFLGTTIGKLPANGIKQIDKI